MKNYLLPVILCSFLSIAAPGDAFLDIFTVYGKRNNQIDQVIRDALESTEEKWKRTRVPITEEYVVWSAYAPESEGKNHKTTLNFSELHYAKHPTIHSLEDLILDVQKKAAKRVQFSTTKNDKEITYDYFITFNVISKEPSSVYYELYDSKQLVSQKNTSTTEKEPTWMKKFDTANEVDIGKSEEYPIEMIEPSSQENSVNWVISLGNGEFREYSYFVKKRMLTDAEKKYILKLFKYINNGIDDVGA